MTYSFRLSLTTSGGNKIPVPAPDHYDPARFEVMRRYVQAHGASSVGFDRYSVPGGKVDGNNSIGRQFSLGLVGGAKDWAEADESGRSAILDAHKQYTLEFLYFLSNDPVFSASQRASVAQWGLCADEFPDTGHWPPQLYVRESRRMQGMYVINQGDIIGDPVKPDPIMVSSFPIDSHDCRRIAYPGGGVHNEGTIFPVRQSGRGYPYHVPYRAILPQPAECANLLVPVALSCTHVAICSLRVEATWMLIGQSAGIAAAMAADRGVAVQNLAYPDLRTRLLARGQVLELPEEFAPLRGIVLDDPDAELIGAWSTSTTMAPYVGDGYRYSGTAGTPNDGSATATFRFTVTTGGVYQLNMAYSPHETRATNVLLALTSGPYVTNFSVDQTVPRPPGSVVRPIGTVKLFTGTETVVTIGTAHTVGFVILDALQLVLDTPETDDDTTTSFQEGVSPTEAYTHDAVYIRSGDADANFNGDADREVIAGPATGDALRSLIEFDVRAIPPSRQILSVSLVLTTLNGTPGINNVGGAGAPTTFNLYVYGFDIDETTATWNTPAAGDGMAGGALGTLLSSAAFDVEVTGQTVTFGDTPSFRAAVSDALAGDGFLRAVLRGDDETVTPARNRPELRVVTIQGVLPGTVLIVR